MSEIRLDTTVIGPVDVDVSQIMQGVYAGGEPAYPRHMVEAWARANIRRSREFGFRTSGCVGQQCHETGFLWSRVEPNQVQPEQFNFGGVGATNDGAAGLSARTIDEGVLIYYCHLALYVYGPPEEWPPHLRKYARWALRLDAVRWAHENTKRPDGSLLRFLGTVKTYGDFVNGRWAYSPQYPRGTLSNGYARAIVRIANEIRSYPVKDELVNQPTQRLIDLLIQRGHEVHDMRGRLPANAKYPYLEMPLSDVRYIIHHWTGDRFTAETLKTITGTDYGEDVITPRMSLEDEIDLLSWYARYHMSKDDGTWGGIAYGTLVMPSGRIYVAWDIGVRTYHAFRANSQSYAVCGPIANGAPPTAKQLAGCRDVWDILANHTPEIPAGQGDLYGHKEATFLDERNRTACPGTFMRAVQAFREGEQPAPVEENPNALEINGYWIINLPEAPILDYWRETGGVEMWGLPLGGMHKRGDLYVQLFENGELEAWPDGWGHFPGPHVKPSNLGRRFLEVAGAT